MRLVWRFWCFSLLMLCHFCSKHDLCHWSVCLLRRNKLWFGVVWHSVDCLSCRYFTSFFSSFSLSLSLSLLPSIYHDILLLVCFFYTSLSFVYFFIIVTPVLGLLHFFSPLKIRFFLLQQPLNCIYNLWIVHSNKQKIASYKSYEPTSNNRMNSGCIYLSLNPAICRSERINFAMRFFQEVILSLSYMKKCVRNYVMMNYFFSNTWFYRTYIYWEKSRKHFLPPPPSFQLHVHYITSYFETSYTA